MKIFNKQRILTFGTLGILSTTLLGGSMIHTAEAKSSTWKKVAIGAAAVTGYGLIKGNKTATVAGAAVTAGSYYKYKKNKKNENRYNYNYRGRRGRR